MFQIGDLVTRISYNNDIVFKIINIKDDIYILKGLFVRLYADSPKEDLKKYKDESKDEFLPEIDNYRTLDRDLYFYLPGSVLHLDQDADYADKCRKFYKKNKIKANVIYVGNDNLNNIISESLNRFKPDILVVTGHDSMQRKKENNNKYKNSSIFASAIRTAREYESSHEKLIVIAGACQSNYEELIKAGANFASSPKRINIHALDPAIIATSLAFSDRNKDIDLIKILNKTKYGPDGIGGIITKGTMYIGYPR